MCALIYGRCRWVSSPDYEEFPGSGEVPSPHCPSLPRVDPHKDTLWKGRTSPHRVAVSGEKKKRKQRQEMWDREYGVTNPG